jgi:hypothetical protein
MFVGLWIGILGAVVGKAVEELRALLSPESPMFDIAPHVLDVARVDVVGSAPYATPVGTGWEAGAFNHPTTPPKKPGAWRDTPVSLTIGCGKVEAVGEFNGVCEATTRSRAHSTHSSLFFASCIRSL